MWVDITSGLLAGEECKSGYNNGRLHSLPSEYSWHYILYSVFMVSYVCLKYAVIRRRYS